MQSLIKEEQRYGRNKETVINRAYIESGEYRKKFDRISNDAELNKLLYQLAKRMLIHRSGTLYEDMYWIDPETLQVVASETNCELEQRIVYSDATKRAIRGKEGLSADMMEKCMCIGRRCCCKKKGQNFIIANIMGY